MSELSAEERLKVIEYLARGTQYGPEADLQAIRYHLSRAKQYTCPVCGSNDPNLYLRCNRPDCTDGRDPR